MLLKVHSASVLGIEAEMIDVEVDLSIAEKQTYHVVGLPDTAVKESGKRVKAAIHNCGFDYPITGNITVNLAPADFKKEGSCYDLPIALAILGIVGPLRAESMRDWLTCQAGFGATPVARRLAGAVSAPAVTVRASL